MKASMFSVFILVVVATFSRLIPHPWNFTAMGAAALFAGAYLRPWPLAWLVPLASFILSDAVIGFHSTLVYTYAALLLSTGLGVAFLGRPRWFSVSLFSLLTSALFFTITNFGVWNVGGLYTHDFRGLVECYAMAIPFFKNQALGDLVFSGVLFGTYGMIVKILNSKTIFGSSSRV